MLKRVCSLLLCLLVMSQACLAFAYDGTEFDGPIVVPADSPSIPNVNFAMLYEETTGTVMLTKYPDRTNAPASMTKVMTALLVLEHNPTLEGSTIVPPEAVSEKYCYWLDTWHLEAGEEVTIWDLMNYFLIVSGNEAGTTLAAYVARLVKADTLVLLSDINGLYTADPRQDANATLIPEVREITPEILELAGGSGTSLGTGGMATGIDMIIANGQDPESLYGLMEGKNIGTRFVGETK